MRRPEVEQNAQILGVPVVRDGSDVLVPGESVTNPVAMTQAFCAEAERVGASLRLGQRVVDDLADYNVVVNCAGLFADEVARMFGDDSFAIVPRKGEFLVFRDTDPGLAEILLPVPTPRTKGILVFPTLDGHVCCGPTAVDMTDKSDWSVRDEARSTLSEQARAVLPGLGAEPLFAYAGLRPAGANGENYVIGWSSYSDRLLNVAAIRSTGLTAALGIADYVCSDLLGIDSSPVPYGRGTASSRRALVAADRRLPRPDVKVLIGIDEGTSAVKAAMFDLALNPIASVRRDKQTSHPGEGTGRAGPGRGARRSRRRGCGPARRGARCRGRRLRPGPPGRVGARLGPCQRHDRSRRS